jgi:hypothetical protein
MSRVRSIKGEIVDFDFMRTKKKMEDRSKSKEVEMRENYVDIKRRRRNPYRNVAELVEEQRKNEDDVRSRLRAQKAQKEADGEGIESTPEPTTTATPTATSRRTSKTVVKRKQPTPTSTPDEDDTLEEDED